MTCGLEKRVTLKKSGCQIKAYGGSIEAHVLPMLGSFEVLTESKTSKRNY